MLPEDAQAQIKICPFLGTANDAETCSAYPSPRNYCHRARPVAVVDPQYQVTHCLTEWHSRCPVYARRDNGPLPKGLGYHHKMPRRQTPMLWVGLFLVIAIGAWAAWQFLLRPSSTIGLLMTDQAPLQPQSSSLATSATAIPPSVTVTPTRTEVAIVTTTQTPLPSATPALTMYCAYALEQPVNSYGITLVMHRVQVGESLPILADTYETSVAAIQAVNFFLPSPLWVDLVIVIPTSTSDVADLPVLEPVQVAEEDISLEELAEKLLVAPIALRTANNLDDSCRLFSGWLMVPRETPAS